MKMGEKAGKLNIEDWKLRREIAAKCHLFVGQGEEKGKEFFKREAKAQWSHVRGF